MLFNSKKDKTYLSMMGFIILVAFSGLILPIIIGSSADFIVPISIFVATVGFLLWFIFSMKYILLDEQLLLKSAFIRKKILYENITSIRRINSLGVILTGYQLLTSKKGLEISYNTGVIGSVKISPEDEEGFIANLQKHCPDLSLKEFTRV